MLVAFRFLALMGLNYEDFQSELMKLAVDELFL